MTAYPYDSLGEFCLIGIQVQGGSEVQFGALTEDISAMNWTDKPIETTALVSGGHCVKRTVAGMESISFKCYPISADMDGTGVVQLFHPIGTGSGSADVTEPIAISNSNQRRKYRLVLLWSQNLPLQPTAASTVPVSGEAAYRVQIFNAYMNSYKPSYDGKTMSAEITFSWAPFTKAGAANKIEESTSGTSATLAAVTAFS